jgi:hypothetical protein
MKRDKFAAKSLICCARMYIRSGEVAEWSIASDLKSDEVKASESSNLSLSVLKECWLKNSASISFVHIYLVIAPSSSAFFVNQLNTLSF